MSTLYVDNLQPNLGSQVEIPNLKPLAGSILQVQQSVLTTTWAGGGNATTFYTTPLTVTLTPANANSKFLIEVSASIGSGYWEIQGRFRRNGTAIGIGDARGSRARATFVDNRYEGQSSVRNAWGTVTASYLDSPATSSDCTYDLQLNGYSSFVVGLNYNPYADSDNADYFATPISTLTVTEIAQ
jgi:hypothetical protein